MTIDPGDKGEELMEDEDDPGVGEGGGDEGGEEGDGTAEEVVEEGEEEEGEESVSEEESEEDSPEDRLRALELQNTYLRGQLSTRERAGDDPKSGKEEEVEDPEEIITEENLRKDPSGTIRKALAALKKIALNEAEKTSTRLGLNEAARQKQSDLAISLESYPELRADNPHSRLASQIYRDLVQAYGDRPGFLKIAADSAYGAIQRMNKTDPKKKVTLREMAKKAASPHVNGKLQGVKGDGKKDPFLGLAKDDKDRRLLDKMCKDLGISPKEFRERYEDGKKVESSWDGE